MSHWPNEYNWVFPNVTEDDVVGFNDPGIGTFKSRPFLNLSKEIIQNVLDARSDKISDDDPVIARFSYMDLDLADMPGAAALADAIDNCGIYWEDGESHDQLMQLKEYSDKYLRGNNNTVPVLKISDYNTTGLDGVDDPDDKKSKWYGLVRSAGSNNKSDDSNGSQGIGKFATFTLSRLRTVLYSTQTEDGKKGVQGKTILASFRDAEGFHPNKANFGKKGDNIVLPMTDGIPEVFRRECPGTDIYIIGFDKADDWIEQLATNAIEYYFYAIYKGSLRVEFIDGEKMVYIDKGNIEEKIEEYRTYVEDNYEGDSNIRYSAPMYWKAITDTSEKHYHVTKEFQYKGKGMGEYELFLLMDPNANGHNVLEMRKSGMKIMEDSGFRLQQSFIGAFIATGNKAASNDPDDNISSFLRKCEDAKHDTWSAANYPKVEDRSKAQAIIKEIHRLIKEEIKSHIPQNEDLVIKGIGLTDMLLGQGNGDSGDETEAAFWNASPLPIEMGIVHNGLEKEKDISKVSNGRGKNTTDIPKDEPDDPVNKKTRDNHQGKSKRIAPVVLSCNKTIFDEEKGGYKLAISSDDNVSNLQLRVNVSGDDGQVEPADIISASMSGTALSIKQDYVLISSIEAAKKYVIDVQLRGGRRERLEVHAYGKLQ